MFIRMILVLLVSLYTSRVVLRVLGFVDFGIYNIVGSVVVFLTFLRMALTNATYRYLAFELGRGDKKRLIEIYSMAINCHIILALLVIILLEIGGLWFINTHLNIPYGRLGAANWVFQFSILAFAVNVIQTPFNSCIIAHERMDFYALVSIVEVILKLAIVYILSIGSIDKLVLYGFLQLIVALFVCFCYIFYCNRMFKNVKYIRFWDNTIAKDFISYSGWSMIVNVADISATQSMSIFLNLFIGVIANAAMGITQQVVGNLNNFLANFTQAMNPQIIKSYAAEQYELFMKLVFTSSKLSYFLLLLVTLPVIANIEFILDVWLVDYPRETPTYIRTIVWYNLIESSQLVFLQAVHATGRIRNHQIMMSCLKFASIPAMYFTLLYGYSGKSMIFVWVFFSFIWCSVRLIYMHFLINMSLKQYFKEVLIKVIVVSLLVIPTTYWLAEYLNSGFYGFIASSIYSTSALLFLSWIYGLSQKERQLIMSLAPVKKITQIFSS